MRSFKKDVRIIGIHCVAIHNSTIFIPSSLALKMSSCENVSSIVFGVGSEGRFSFLKITHEKVYLPRVKFEKSALFNLH